MRGAEWCAEPAWGDHALHFRVATPSPAYQVVAGSERLVNLTTTPPTRIAAYNDIIVLRWVGYVEWHRNSTEIELMLAL